jgi:D-glycero-D-manno-heptose 1,7-bisphosphate phosphatase
MMKAVFLDRDGVLNRTVLVEGIPKPPTSVGNVEILAGVSEAISLLRRHEFLPVVITNQPDIARGSAKLIEVDLINRTIGKEIGVDHFYVCPHDDNSNCLCRKPKSGLIEIAVQELGIDLEKSFLVGDRWRDIQAGQAVGLTSFFIDYSYNEIAPKQPFITVSSLLDAVIIMIGGKSGT